MSAITSTYLVPLEGLDPVGVVPNPVSECCLIQKPRSRRVALFCLVPRKPVHGQQQIEGVRLVDPSCLNLRGLQSQENSRATCRTGTEVCPKASFFRSITTRLRGSKCPQTRCKKLISMEISSGCRCSCHGGASKGEAMMQRRLVVLSA